MALVDLVVQMVLGIALTAAIIRRDERRLSEAQLGRAWNEPSFWVAVVAFGPLCIPVHFTKVRRSIGGFLLGLVWMIVALAVLSIAAEILHWGLEALSSPRA